MLRGVLAIVRVGLLVILAGVALASAAAAAVGLWRQDLFLRHGFTPGPDGDVHDFDIVNNSGGGLLVARNRNVMPPESIIKFSLTLTDGTLIDAVPGEGWQHARDGRDSHPHLTVGGRSRLYGTAWFGLVTDPSGGWRGVLPWPAVTLAAGAWPAVAGWRGWHLRRRGTAAFPVVPHGAS